VRHAVRFGALSPGVSWWCGPGLGRFGVWYEESAAGGLRHLFGGARFEQE